MAEQLSAKQQSEQRNPVETYESYWVPAMFGPWASRLVQSSDPRPGERVLDVGCGTGIVARQAAVRVAPGGTVSGLDISPDMLAVARVAAEREGAGVEWHEGRAEELPFSDQNFDLALCQFALMFFADQRVALGEISRVLAAGGRVVLSVFQSLDLHPFYQELDKAIQEHLGVPGVQQIFALGDADALRTMFSDTGLQHVNIESVSMTVRFPDPGRFLASEIDVDTAAIPSMQNLDAAGRQSVTAAIRDQMEGPLRAVTHGGHVALPFHVYIVRAER